MKINSLGLGKNMIELTVTEAYNMAGVYNDDDDFVKDSKLFSWLGGRRHRCIQFDAMTYSAQLEKAAADQIEVLIIKENQDVSES
jgi:hypothetical protein